MICDGQFWIMLFPDLFCNCMIDAKYITYNQIVQAPSVHEDHEGKMQVGTTMGNSPHWILANSGSKYCFNQIFFTKNVACEQFISKQGQSGKKIILKHILFLHSSLFQATELYILFCSYMSHNWMFHRYISNYCTDLYITQCPCI